MIIKYLGHSSFEIKYDDKVIYIDPYVGEYKEQADLVLITHEHYDHNKIELVKLKNDAIVYRSKDFINNGLYRTIKYDKLVITGVPAYNSNHDINKCVGFIIEYNNHKLYFAGDTSETDYMKDLGNMHLDYCFLPVDGVYNMDAIEATKCAELINAKYSIPIHTYVGMLYDKKIALLFNPVNKLELLPNEYIEI